MKLPDADWRQQPGLDRLLDALDAADGATRFVGGAVRDTLLGLPVTDVDLASRLAPEDSRRRIEAAGFKAVPTGIAHGTVTAVLPNGPIEVTTLRRDVVTDGRHATVAYTDDWREDAARRDFTINALLADPVTGAVTDFFDGETDLAHGRVRFIGAPLQRIAEDHLRILRFFRFHARFGRGAPDGGGLAACIARANDLMALSRERIADEILKLLATADPLPAVGTMQAHGILAPVLPEISREGVEALGRLIAREASLGAATGDPLRRLAALLPPQPAVVQAVAQRLRLSKVAQKRLVLAAGREPGDSAAAPTALAYTLGREAAVDRLLLGEAAPEAALAGLEGWQRPALGLSGGDLIALGLPPGPIVAATLQAIERAWIAEGFPDGDRVRALAAELTAQALRARQ